MTEKIIDFPGRGPANNPGHFAGVPYTPDDVEALIEAAKAMEEVAGKQGDELEGMRADAEMLRRTAIKQSEIVVSLTAELQSARRPNNFLLGFGIGLIVAMLVVILFG